MYVCVCVCVCVCVVCMYIYKTHIYIQLHVFNSFIHTLMPKHLIYSLFLSEIEVFLLRYNNS